MKFTKKFFAVIFAVLMIASVFLSACEKKEEEVGEDIDTKASVQTIMENARAAAGEGAFIPMTLDLEVTADNCQAYTGLSP